MGKKFLLSLLAGMTVTVALISLIAAAPTNPPKYGGFYSSDGTGNPGTWLAMKGTGTPYTGATPAPAGLMVSTDGTGNPGTWVASTAATFAGPGTANTFTAQQTFQQNGNSQILLTAPDGETTSFTQFGDGNAQSYWCSGAKVVSSAFTAVSANPVCFSAFGAAIVFYANTGVTPGNTFTPAEVFRLQYSAGNYGAALGGQTIVGGQMSTLFGYAVNGASVVDGSRNIIAGNGANIVLRCTTAGTLPIGALTITAGNCGASVDSGLRLK